MLYGLKSFYVSFPFILEYLQNITIVNTAFSQPVEIKGKERRTLDDVNASFHSLS